MKIAGTGVDLIEVARIADAIRRHGDRFIGRIFTPGEARYCRSKGSPAQHFAARFAAKEAVVKLLGARGSGWREIEVLREASGKPSIALFGEAAARAERMGIRRLHLSMSHTAEHAVAHAIAESE